MPDPSNYASREEFLSDCVPMMIGEGKPQDQAVAACSSMWEDHGKAMPSEARGWATLTVKSLDSEHRMLEGWASKPEVDRIGDIVDPMGCSLKTPMPLLWAHRHDEPVGHVLAATATKEGISIRARIAKIVDPGPLKDSVDRAWQAVKAGLVQGLSIGFRPREFEPIENGGLRFTKSDIFEISLVVVPACASATITAVKSADQAASGHTAPTTGPGATGKTSISLKRSERTKMSKTISEQIEALQAARAAKDAQMDSIMTKAMDAGRSTDDAEREEFDTLQREVEEIDADLKRLDYLEKRNRAQAKPVTPAETKTVADGAAARGGYVRVRAPDLPKGVRFARVARCVGLSRGNLVAAAQIAEQMYGTDQPIVNILKAAVSAGTTMDATWAGSLVSDEGAVFADFLEFLRPMTIVGKFGTGNIPALRNIPFRVPVGSQTSGGAAYWTGEAQAKGLTRFDFARTTLEPLKVAWITVVTEELLKYAALPAEVLLRDQLAAAIAAKIDTDFIDPTKTAVVNVSPASITNTATPVASSGVTADAARADVSALLDNFIAADNPASSAVWVMSASTALRLSMMYNSLGQSEFNGISVNGGTFAGFPVIVSEYVGTSGGSPNTRYVWLVNARDVFFAEEGLRIDMSREASLVMDSAPTAMHAGELGSPSAPLAAAMVSMFQTDSIAFRAERTLNWAKARTEAVQGLSGVAWGT